MGGKEGAGSRDGSPVQKHRPATSCPVLRQAACSGQHWQTQEELGRTTFRKVPKRVKERSISKETKSPWAWVPQLLPHPGARKLRRAKAGHPDAGTAVITGAKAARCCQQVERECGKRF